MFLLCELETRRRSFSTKIVQILFRFVKEKEWESFTIIVKRERERERGREREMSGKAREVKVVLLGDTGVRFCEHDKDAYDDDFLTLYTIFGTGR